MKNLLLWLSWVLLIVGCRSEASWGGSFGFDVENKGSTRLRIRGIQRSWLDVLRFLTSRDVSVTCRGNSDIKVCIHEDKFGDSRSIFHGPHTIVHSEVYSTLFDQESLNTYCWVLPATNSGDRREEHVEVVAEFGTSSSIQLGSIYNYQNLSPSFQRVGNSPYGTLTVSASFDTVRKQSSRISQFLRGGQSTGGFDPLISLSPYRQGRGPHDSVRYAGCVVTWNDQVETRAVKYFITAVLLMFLANPLASIQPGRVFCLGLVVATTIAFVLMVVAAKSYQVRSDAVTCNDHATFLVSRVVDRGRISSRKFP